MNPITSGDVLIRRFTGRFNGRFCFADNGGKISPLCIQEGAEEYKIIAEKHYGQWFESVSSFLVTFKSVIDRGDYKQTAFLRHQATERFYACLLLVLTVPRQHQLDIIA